MKEFIDAFRALRHAPLALWLVVFAFSFELMSYYGALPLMKPYLAQDIGISPVLASLWVSLFTGLLSVAMLFLGKPAEDKLGIRKGLLVALALALVGQAFYGVAPFMGGAATVLVSLLFIAAGEGILQPIAYAGVKKYTSESNGAMGYAVLYASFNLAIAIVGPISAKVRTTWDARHEAGISALSGFNAVNWVCVGITAGTLVVIFSFMTKGVESKIVRETTAAAAADGGAAGRSPLRDARFMFFIFMLLPVRTLFAHQWLTMPEYVLRSYPKEVADRMEWLVDSVNPAIIFFGVPAITALTRRFHVLTMMIVGSAVSALATFILCFGPHTSSLIAYFFVFSIGEAFWSSRFLQYASELAPPGRTAQYMGIANLPWLFAKTTTGFYSGWVLERFCPKDGAKNTETMWLLYGLIALLSPLGLLLARKWLHAGMQPAAEPSAGS